MKDKRACLRNHCRFLLKIRVLYIAWNTDEESDASNLTVSEKQTGVRFENVKKIYNTDQGEVLAVDDFNLKLNEGEVTSLLGRNGAGKTTIMYVHNTIPSNKNLSSFISFNID